MSDQEKRLRSHPVERFAGESHIVDLRSALSQLRAEKHFAPGGHRQVAIFHRAPVTQVLFDFDEGGELVEHAANGLVTIHGLEGRLRVQVAEQVHELGAGMMIVLAPNVRHSVRALTAGAMLLTVTLEANSAGG